MSEYNHVMYSLPRINVLTNRLLKRGRFNGGGGGGGGFEGFRYTTVGSLLKEI